MAGPAASLSRRSSWALLWLVAVLVQILLYPALFADLWSRWLPGQDLEQGLLLLVFTVLALFLPREQQHPYPVPPAVLWLLLAIAQSVLLLSLWLSLQGLAQLAIAASVPLFVGLIAGRQAFAVTLRGTLIITSAFPVFYLIGPFLQGATVIVSTGLMRLLDVQVYVQANYFELGTGIVEVAEGCSGLKYFVSAFALVAMLNVVSAVRWPIELYRYLVALLLAMLCNWIRVSYLILHADWFGVDAPLLASHDFFGWIIFGATLLAFEFLTRPTEPRLQRWLGGESRAADQASARHWQALALLPPLLAAAAYLRPLTPTPTAPAALPDTLAGYQLAGEASWTPVYENVGERSTASYRQGDCELVAGELRYPRPEQGAEVLNGGNQRFSRDEGWRETAVGLPNAVAVRYWRTEARQDRSARQRVLLWWHQVGDRITLNRRQVMAQQLKDRISGRVHSEAIRFVGFEPSQCAGNLAAGQALARHLQGVSPRSP
ncbi:MAG: exosortase/archaeosortase family protein [Pseudomonadota bacterium]